MATANAANAATAANPSMAVNSNVNAEKNNNHNNNLKLKSSSFDLKFTGNHSTVATPFNPTNPIKKEPFRTRILNSFTGGPARSGSPKSASSRRTLSYPTPTPNRASVTTNTSTKPQHETASHIVASEKNARKVPAYPNGKNGIAAEVSKESTSTMLSPGASYVSQTTNWIADQSHLDQSPPPSSTSYAPQSSLENTPSRPVLLPARGFNNNNKMEHDLAERESALRSLEGRNPRRELQDERNSDEADLFLQVAQEEDDMNRQKNPVFNRLDSRKSRIAMRQSLPAPNFRSAYFRREADQETKPTARYAEEAEGLPQVLGDNPSARTGPATSTTSIPSEQRKRSYATASLSNPTTPRTNNREGDYESQSYLGRRPSIQDRTITAYRQSSLSTSYSIPRTTTYHSSPLVAQPMEIGEQHETQRATEGTASTVSTTAPSTVWDELDDLKSRIHRLELTGKLPTTSGAAVSRATHERPPTAATTETTMSTSPKRGRGNSISPTEAPSVDVSKVENHPLLRSALLNSKPLLDPEIYKSLEATANDALAISAMMGTSGQPGPISSSQSSIGGAHSNFSDRQVRRKADSLCRSLTELCLSLSERRSNDHDATLTQLRQNVRGQDVELRQTVEPVSPRQPPSIDIAKLKASPRSYSRLEARRSTLLGTNALPTLRYPPPENTAPAQSLAAGRRTSLLLRSRRAETEDPQETVEARFRAPSRAKTDVGRRGEIPREEMQRSHFPEDDMRSGTATSSLALRRSYTTSLSPNRAPQPSPLTQINTGRRYYERTPEREILVNSSLSGSGGGRRYLERTPDRDTTSLSGRLAEERGQRKVSGPLGLGGRSRAGSLMRSKDPLGPSQSGSYQ
ncbi:hypothetical protein SS1G_06953 [Sclerotinia sclerotiorum 1980 UF-70]|uniref:LPXTG-motif cell wall anchor domain protein n=2 Tax=Sclerotinia sclerotiorum (strain ATCC 18683 / 1980 / Ss-1) TaxID=665079 RepID=A7ENQ4_SCLS1|nr:hypothetical protein SS1G_06953 [Sclerotinia sclerotiorum 1980 UF-70]APA10523.1 hypothetical protein sscle_06g052930 [Sclerotinia sclerotiorum 1980 UF-70]EDO04470.1 hypothetical protein SS1G_06953 [Sclerotinia sclerotiorum 1980 UF-70]